MKSVQPSRLPSARSSATSDGGKCSGCDAAAEAPDLWPRSICRQGEQRRNTLELFFPIRQLLVEQSVSIQCRCQ